MLIAAPGKRKVDIVANEGQLLKTNVMLEQVNALGGVNGGVRARENMFGLQ